MKVVFVATGDIALPSWDWLQSSDCEILALVTQPDKPAGRRMVLTAPEVKLRAIEAGIPVMQPESLRKKSAIDAVAALSPDLIVVMAYGQILTERFLAIPRVACINLHGSLLPKYRGASCIQATIAAGDEETGITVMHMVRELDAGDIVLQKSLPLDATSTAGKVHDDLAELAAVALAEAVELFAQGAATRTAQDPLASSYVGKMLREDGRIDWAHPAERLEKIIRAYDPWPGTFTQLESGQRLKLFPFAQVMADDSLEIGQARPCELGLLVGCGAGALLLGDVQAEGGKRMSSLAYARGMRGVVKFH